MLRTGAILEALYERIRPAAGCLKILDLRIGLGYVGVRLENGAAGLAAMLFDAMPSGCTLLRDAGSIAGSPAASLLPYLVEGRNPLERAMGLAMANALTDPPRDAADDREATACLDLQAGERVVMIGLFAPLVPRILAAGATLTVIERNPERMKIPDEKDREAALKGCDVAIITATTLLNNTCEETINRLGAPRSAAMIGPSTPLHPEIFLETPMTHLGGAIIVDPERVLRIISEAGGTPAMRPALRFVNLALPRELARA